ncbi:cyclase family protein [Paenarthrobacter sp. Z7-10]|uniref:cyclase family protein n=1 Tax=Paenarthrobacter sp. Z7-10 TaxID=2787635 RepID=UPI0022A9156C|nr:cyclase family protein [Paenarthrobacter sp. Z7-10]MCZ2404754.1 cyclase family protein [Paenarthrobacter sp. Z7-10]
MSEQTKTFLDRRVVDLTLLLAEELPAAWAKHMPYQQKTFNYFVSRDDQVSPLKSEIGPYQTRWLLIDEHTGTHVDAPAHFIPEPKTGLPKASQIGTITVEQIPLAQLIGPAVVVDISKDLPGSAPGVSPIITAESLADWERDNGAFTAGDIVLFRTGWDRHYVAGAAGLAYSHHPLVTGTSAGWPAPDAGAMQLLMDRGVTCVGTDGASMGSSHDGAAVHHLALGARVAFIEALGHLHQLPVRGALFCFAPLKVARGTGAPGRAFAWVPDAPGS